jgi:pimeloyl-ACP methyl ester carboxylesterase
MPLPVLVFVHGAWHSPEYYDRVIARLEPLGYKCIVVSMPSVGRIPATSSLDEDIEAIRNTVLAELDAGQDVIVNAHSWGGIPTCSALDGLSKQERALDGKCGVVKLTFVTSFILPEGASLQDAIGGQAPGPSFFALYFSSLLEAEKAKEARQFRELASSGS